MFVILGMCCCRAMGEGADEFKNPPMALRPMPLFFLNGRVTAGDIGAQLRDSRDKSGFGGVAPLPLANTLPKFLTDAYFSRYGDILSTSRDLGMEVILYDDDGFPSGSAAGRLEKYYPDDTIKHLEIGEVHVQGPVDFSRVLPPGKLMGAVAFNAQTLKRLDITAFAANGKLIWKAPAGTWEVMFFTCAKADSSLVDFLSPESVDKFIALTYDEYFKRLPEHFGTTIRRNHFSDVGFCDQARPWTPAFNEKFEKKYGVSPVTLYPALWHDIGPDTQSARVALFGFHADLLSEGYPARVGQWCRAHGLQNSGHPSGGSEANPVDLHGDIFKFFRHVDIPMMDASLYHGYGREGFKLVSSAATMYDRQLVGAEEFGLFAEKSFDPTMLYRTGIELFVRGANRVVPRGMWLDPLHVGYPPLLSHFSDKVLPALPGYSEWSARCCLMLEGGRPVVDLAVLYPIASLEASYDFSFPDKLRWGKFVPPEVDYLLLSDMLTCHVRRDFTFLHPEELEAQCTRQGAILHLNNTTLWQSYQAIVIPGGKVIPWASLKKIKEFYDNGGRVVATTCLPEKSAELGHDNDVRKAIAEMFGSVHPLAPVAAGPPLHIRIEVAGETIKTFVDGTFVDARTDPTFRQGGIGFREADHESATFTNVKVTSPEGSVLFADDFRGNLDKWLSVGNASVREGELTVKENQFLRSREGAAWGDYAFEADIVTKGGAASFVFRAADENNCYMWQFRPSTHRLIPYKETNGKWQDLPAAILPDADYSVTPFQTNSNPHGGKSYFAPSPTVGTLRAILDDAVPVPDVAFDPALHIGSGKGFLSCLHKQTAGRDTYYFANSSDNSVDTVVRLRGDLAPQLWSPHTGEKSPAEVTHLQDHGQAVTCLHLKLAPVTSVFVVAP